MIKITPIDLNQNIDIDIHAELKTGDIGLFSDKKYRVFLSYDDFKFYSKMLNLESLFTNPETSEGVFVLYSSTLMGKMFRYTCLSRLLSDKHYLDDIVIVSIYRDFYLKYPLDVGYFKLIDIDDKIEIWANHYYKNKIR